jgi:peptide/nickel transport system substrate-binding protein
MRELSRRRFLVGSTVALGSVSVGALASACGGGAGGGGSGSGGSGSGSSIATFTAVFQGSGTAEGIDPGINIQFIDEARLKALYDGLFEVDDQMRPVPRLAESGEPNRDGTVWRIRLRDARWHDGHKLTADDVLYTLARVLGPPESRPFAAAATLEPIDLSLSRAVDERTVEITLKRPFFEFLTALAAYGTKIVRNGTRDFRTAVGTGPFRFESFTPGKQLVANAYRDYWDGPSPIQQLKILSADADARANVLLASQVDFVDTLTPAAANRLRNTADMTVHTTPNSGIYYFAMKTDRPPFNNPDVRRALMHMVDREELTRVALEGQAQIGNDVFGKGYQYYADLPQHTFDPELARSLLRTAGVPDLRFDLYTAPAAAGLVEAASLFATQAHRGGATVNVVLGAKDTYYSDALKINALTMGQSGPLPIPNHFASRLLTHSPQNRANWTDPTFDALYGKAQASATESDRTAIYRQMHEMLYDRGGFLYWANANWTNAAPTKFRNIPTGVPNSTNWARFNKVSL